MLIRLFIKFVLCIDKVLFRLTKKKKAQKGFQKFKCGKFSLEDDARFGGLSSVKQELFN